MPSLKLFGVTFDRSTATYMPGETVSGKIILDTIKEKQVRALYVSTKRISYVHWNERDSIEDSETRTYSNSEIPFQVQHIWYTGRCSKIKRTYPLLIGTIPLYYPSFPPPYNVVPHSSNSDVIKPAIMPVSMPMPEQASATNIPTAPTQDLANSSSFTLDIPPPAYEECMSGTQNIRDHNESDFVFGENTSFAPRYPVFNYPAPSISK